MLKSYVRKLTFLFLLGLISNTVAAASGTPLLKGKINATEPAEVNVVYDYNGDMCLSTFKTDADGSFVFSSELPCDAVEAMVYVDGQPFGAYLQKGATTVMDITDNASFTGDNAAESTFVNAYVQGFYPMNYKPSPDQPFVFADYKAKLDGCRDNIKGLITDVKADKRGLYNRLTDSYYNQTLLTLLNIDSYYSKTDHKAEVEEIISTVDPNSDEARLTGIITAWYNNSDIHKNTKAKNVNDYLVGQYAAIDSVLTNEANKKSLWYTLGSMLMMYRLPEEEINSFFAAVEPQLSKAPNVKERLIELYESMKPKVSDGDAVPTDPVLISPDGSRCKLSELLGKSVVYIDIWATWCGPCCREIPYMEKVVAQFKGNDAISFISISRDDNRQAWLKKLDRDKPEWPQYIFEKSSGDEFMDAMGISGIPRFLLIGKDGRFISTDAERPSDENIVGILNAAIAQ